MPDIGMNVEPFVSGEEKADKILGGYIISR
jgi:hypothetical protein